MIDQTIFLRFGASLLIGILIGMQREYAHGSSKGTGQFAGACTFSLMSLVGSTAAFLADTLVFSIGSKALRKYIWPIMALMLVIGLGMAFLL